MGEDEKFPPDFKLTDILVPSFVKKYSRNNDETDFATFSKSYQDTFCCVNSIKAKRNRRQFETTMLRY